MPDYSRRGFLKALGIAGTAGTLVIGCRTEDAAAPATGLQKQEGSPTPSTGDQMNSAREALQRLYEGNQRFVEGVSTAATDAARRTELLAGQQPFAVIIGCADSRVPVEHVFDQGFGELFVIRVAGNIATPSNIGSAEYAVAKCGTRLIVVMGHTHCGAVTAALEEVMTGKPLASPNLRAITDLIRPEVALLLEGQEASDLPQVLPTAVQTNVLAEVDRLQRESALLHQAVTDDGLLIAGAVYSLETGVVTFLEGTVENAG